MQAFRRSGVQAISSALPLFHSSTLLLIAFICLSIPVQAELRAGAARVSITPDPKEFSYPLGGYVAPERLTKKASGIHDTCYSRALVLSDGTVKAAVVSLDLCFLPANVKDAVASKVTATGVPASGLFLSATHTHSALDPLVLHSGNTGHQSALPLFDPKLLDWVATRIAQSITEANASLKPARIGSGQAERIGLNRNRRGESATDDQMTAVKVLDSDGKPLAAVFNYAAHPVYYNDKMLEVSGDWSGSFQRVMEARIPGAVCLFLNGAEGDASPHGSDAGTPAEKIEVYAAKLAEKAKELYDSVGTDSGPVLRAWTHTVELPPQAPHPFFLLASAQLKATREQAIELINRMMPRKCDVSFVRIGDTVLVGLPGEPTTPIGLAVKAALRDSGVMRPAVVALTNGWLGYIVTAEQYKAGKYEPTMSFYGPSIGEVMLEGVKAGMRAEPK